jgi:predicted SnoaL-like aldol condensation-catalyzing enzyme
MPKTTPEQNKAIVLKAFDTLFNKRDYNAAERFWSPMYIQHSAHIAPGREGGQTRCATKTNSLSQKAITSSRTAVSLETEGPLLGSPLTSSVSKTDYSLSTGTYCRTKPQRESPSAAFPCLASAFLRKP